MLDFFLWSLLLAPWLYFGYWLYERHLDRQHKRYLDDTVLQADDLGNYPARYFPSDGSHFVIRPGNAPYPTPVSYLVEGPATYNPPRRIPAQGEIKIYTGRGASQESRPAELPEPQPRPAELPEPDQTDEESAEPSEFSRISMTLARAKREGRGKNESIKILTGYSPGASQNYKRYSEIWDRA